MKKKLIGVSLLAMLQLQATTAQAQFMFGGAGLGGMNTMGGAYPGMPWGAGLYGGMQGCQSMFPQMLSQMMPQMMPQQVMPQQPMIDHTAERQAEMNDLREAKREAKEKIDELNRKKDKYEQAINDRLQGDWADQVISHLSGDDSCGCGDNVMPVPVGAPPPDYEPSVLPPPGPPPPAEPPLGPPPTTGHVSQNGEHVFGQRAPAADMPMAPPNRYDNNWQMPGNAGPASSCGSEIASSRAWHFVCRRNGVSRDVCTNPHFTQDRTGSPSACAEAVAKYGEVLHDIERWQQTSDSVDQQISDLRAHMYDHDDGPQGGGPSMSGGANFLSALAPMGASLLMGLGSSLMSMHQSRFQQMTAAGIGVPASGGFGGAPPPVLPALGGASRYGFPFQQSGVYGGLGNNMSMGCGGGFGGMGGGVFTNPYRSMMGSGAPSVLPALGVPVR